MHMKMTMILLVLSACLAGCSMPMLCTDAVSRIGNTYEHMTVESLHHKQDQPELAAILRCEYQKKGSAHKKEQEDKRKLLFLDTSTLFMHAPIHYGPGMNNTVLIPSEYGKGLTEDEINGLLKDYQPLEEIPLNSSYRDPNNPTRALDIRVTSHRDALLHKKSFAGYCAAPLYVPAVALDLTVMPLVLIVFIVPNIGFP